MKLCSCQKSARHAVVLHAHSHSKLHAQRGASMILFVLLVMGTAWLAVLGMSASVLQQTKLTRDNEQQEYLNNVMANAHHWYDRMAPIIEVGSTGVAVSESDFLAQVAPQRKFGIRALVSPRFGPYWLGSGSTATYVPGHRTILIWIPPASGSDATQFVSTSEEPSIDPSVKAAGTYRFWNTRWVQIGLSVESTDVLVKAAKLIGNWAKAQQTSNGGPSFENYFRPTDCSAVTFNYLPCLDSYTDITTTSIPSMFGVANSEFTSKRGFNVEVSTLQDANLTTMPYSITIRIRDLSGSYSSMQVNHPQ